MKRTLVTFCLLILLSVSWASAQNVGLISKPQEKRIDVEVGGSLFTSYRWDERIKRPVLSPVISAEGSYVTRGFPFETRDGDTIDHPHQVGCSFSYGSVNDVDFWNTSTFRKPKELEKMGQIVHQKVVQIKSGRGRGELVTESAWIMPNGKAVLLETTRYIFQAKGKMRWIDRKTTLTANGEDVVFGDSKEGMFAIRLPSELKQDDQFPVKTTNSRGVLSERKTNEKLTGKYFNSEGLAGNRVWGTLGKWAAVSGQIGSENVTVAVFDHPKNYNFPSYMMVRGYGLLALNPFGNKHFDPNKNQRKFTLSSGRSMTFHHRLLVISEKAAPEMVEKEYQNFLN
jgi:hypothetical protein